MCLIRGDSWVALAGLCPFAPLDSYGSAGGPPGAGARGDMPSVMGQCPFDADDEACGLINRSLEVPPLDR